MQSFFFFIVALALLIAVHEFGHFWVARRCGVKVLKFSIGFGKPIWQKVGKEGTQYIVAAIPLGGYVKMLDEREGEVPIEQLDQAFNRQSLGKRTAIVAAGPIANLLFAIVAYWLVFVSGMPGIKPIIEQVRMDSPAAFSQILPGDRIEQVNGEITPTWASVSRTLMAIAEEGGVVDLTLVRQESVVVKKIEIAQQSMLTETPKNIIKDLGLTPLLYDLKPVIGKIIEQQAAAQAGLKTGDIILSTNGQIIESWHQWVEVIKTNPERKLSVSLSRKNQQVILSLTPKRTEQGHGYIGAAVDSSATVVPESLKSELRYGLLPGAIKAIQMTWQMSSLTVKSFIGMLKGEVSTKNLGGPISIAQFAGASADKGSVAFLSFLALISISLGILNLLPIPILDGGHLMLYLFEWVRGKPVSETLQLQGQKIGLILLLALMFFAFFNDLSRLFGL
jgi:regulator of sigma E protease